MKHLSVTLRRAAALILVTAIAAVWASAPPASAARSDEFSNAAVTARLITAEDGVAPGATTVSAGLELRLGEDWKTYWRSPGEVGLPPEIDWGGSENVADVEFLWPAPKRFTAFGIENFGYAGEVVFPLRITLARPGSAARLQANVSLLTCSTVCVPQDFELTMVLPEGTGIDPDAAARISDYAARVPDDGTTVDIAVESAYFDEEFTALTVSARSATAFGAPDVFPELGEAFAFGVPDIRLGEGVRLMWARLPILSSAEDIPQLQVTVTDGARAVTVLPPVVDTAPEPPFALERIVPGMGELAWIALVAVLGGLILNVMPCVLPVLSIKLSSAVKSHGQSRARVRGGFLMSALGVLLFMWALAAATLAARALGVSVGWGLQFQNPVFLAVMILILAIFSANLFGAFNINLPEAWQTRMARADGAPGYSGDLATGAFAAVLATPCSAPFLGTAVAFALSGRPVDIVVIFTALGVGLALPYMLVAAYPGLVTRLPRPGPWMVWLKLVLGLALAVTAAWLFWVLDGVGGRNTAVAVAAGVGLVVLLLSVPRLPRIARAGGVVAMAAASLVAPALLSGGDGDAPAIATNWQEFDRAEIARLVSTGNVVFVDVTADWCLTCKANKALVLDRDPVAAALAQPDVVPMQADWTRPSEVISRYLESFGRFGIPFNVVYGPGAPSGITLPEILSTEVVMDALDTAAERSVAARQ